MRRPTSMWPKVDFLRFSPLNQVNQQKKNENILLGSDRLYTEVYSNDPNFGAIYHFINFSRWKWRNFFLNCFSHVCGVFRQAKQLFCNQAAVIRIMLEPSAWHKSSLLVKRLRVLITVCMEVFFLQFIFSISLFHTSAGFFLPMHNFYNVAF